MITGKTKVAKMIDEYPETLDILISINPLFNKLNNKVLRNTVARRASIADAAVISNIPIDVLLNNLNKALNMNTNKVNCPIPENHTSSAGKEKPEFLNNPDTKLIYLDVREYIENGVDPFFKIKETISGLKEDQVLHLVNSFEPVPLYTVLGGKGYKHFTEKIETIWHIYFYKENSKNSDDVANEIKSDTNPLPDEIIELDVREMAPPEPMMTILSKLPELNKNNILVVHHHREPVMLYEKLEEKGFSAISNKISENYYKIIIRKDN
jgi:uncharacterized protein (DUF2249 family)